MFIDLINNEYGKEDEKRTNSNDSRGNQVSQKQAQSGNGTSQNLATGSSQQSKQQRVETTGNYKMDHIKTDGYDITIANPKNMFALGRTPTVMSNAPLARAALMVTFVKQKV